MSTVTLEYNPITRRCRTQVRGIDIQRLDQHYGNRGRIQGWIADYLNDVREEVGTGRFDLTFRGTRSDYEDVVGEYQRMCASGAADVELEIERDPENHAVDLEETHRKLADILSRIKKHPAFVDQGAFIDGVNKVLNNNAFRVAVIATMSSGKSTLLNAMLGKDLLPSGNFATTALLTYIKDVDGKTEAESWAYNPREKLLRHDCNVDLKVLEDINTPHRDDKDLDIDDERRVLRVDLELDVDWIENIGAGYLVLIDTPGPNTAGNDRHAEVTYRLIRPAEDGDEESADVVLYIMDYTNMEVEDDRKLLVKIADQIKESGIAANDRFIFVVNRVNELRKKKDGTLADGLSRATRYLKEHFQIENPTVIPVDALGARLARSYLNGIELDEEDEEDFDRHHKKLTKFLDVNSAALCSPAVLEEVAAAAPDNGDMARNTLHRSGELVLEAYIRHYMDKYWYPLKLQLAFQRMHERLLVEDSLLALEQNILSADKNVDRARREIDHLDGILQDRGVEEKIEKSFARRRRELNTNMVPCIVEFWQTMEENLEGSGGKDRSPQAARSTLKRLEKEVGELSGKLRAEHHAQVSKDLESMTAALQAEYAEKLAKLFADKQIKIPVPSIREMSSRPINVQKLVPKFTRTEQEDREEDKVRERHPFNPRRWLLRQRYYTETVIRQVDVERTDTRALNTRVATDIRKMMNAYRNESREIQQTALDNLQGEIAEMTQSIKARFETLSEEMKRKLNDADRLDAEAEKARRTRDEYKAFMSELESVAKGPFSC